LQGCEKVDKGTLIARLIAKLKRNDECEADCNVDKGTLIAMLILKLTRNNECEPDRKVDEGTLIARPCPHPTHDRCTPVASHWRAAHSLSEINVAGTS